MLQARRFGRVASSLEMIKSRCKFVALAPTHHYSTSKINVKVILFLLPSS